MPAATGTQGPKTQELRVPNLNLQGSTLKTYTWLQDSVAVLAYSLLGALQNSEEGHSRTQCSSSHLSVLPLPTAVQEWST